MKISYYYETVCSELKFCDSQSIALEDILFILFNQRWYLIFFLFSGFSIFSFPKQSIFSER